MTLFLNTLVTILCGGIKCKRIAPILKYGSYAQSRTVIKEEVKNCP